MTVSSQSSPAPSSAAITAAVSAMSTGRTVIRPNACCAPKIDTAPEYAASGTTATVPFGWASTTAAIAAIPLANASAVPPSSSPSAASSAARVSVGASRA